MSDALATSESFIKTLKSVNDPPGPDQPFKIEVACAAWSQTDFYIPAKAQLIAEWLLTSLSRSQEVKNECPVRYIR